MLTTRHRHHTPSHRTRRSAAPRSTTHPRRARYLYGRFTRTGFHANRILRAGRVRTRSSARLFRFLLPTLSLLRVISRSLCSFPFSPFVHSFIRSPFAGAPIPFELTPLAFFYSLLPSLLSESLSFDSNRPPSSTISFFGNPMTSPPLPSHLQLHQTDQIQRSLTPDGHAQDKRDLAAGMARMSTSDASPLWILQNADASRSKTTHSTHLKLATLQHSKLQVPSPKTSTPIRTCQKSKTCQAPDSRSLAFKLQASSLKDLNRTFRKTRSSFVFLAQYEEDGVEPGTSARTIRRACGTYSPCTGSVARRFQCDLRRAFYDTDTDFWATTQTALRCSAPPRGGILCTACSSSKSGLE
ncbi:hypothetical protein MVEN_00455300 [Mycena venus]|uniref:Uncharacterized protein n=1 Tax=Mycena venus TaxID=2733690 RepID=A0A8H6YVR5_9AGAR|nr:hypothetical protein MVEN_00455300 [Mycena venus]